jgi:hypothetical protein
MSKGEVIHFNKFFGENRREQISYVPIKSMQYSSENNETFTDVKKEECLYVQFNLFSNRQVVSLVLSHLAVNQTGTYQCAILR